MRPAHVPAVLLAILAMSGCLGTGSPPPIQIGEVNDTCSFQALKTSETPCSHIFPLLQVSAGPAPGWLCLGGTGTPSIRIFHEWQPRTGELGLFVQTSRAGAFSGALHLSGPGKTAQGAWMNAQSSAFVVVGNEAELSSMSMELYNTTITTQGLLTTPLESGQAWSWHNNDFSVVHFLRNQTKTLYLFGVRPDFVSGGLHSYLSFSGKGPGYEYQVRMNRMVVMRDAALSSLDPKNCPTPLSPL